MCTRRSTLHAVTLVTHISCMHARWQKSGSRTVKSAVSDLCCRRPSTVSDRFSVHRRFHIQTDLSRATICCARPATAISCTVAAFKSAVSDRDPGSVRCENVLASALSTAKCENALSCKCDRLAPGLYSGCAVALKSRQCRSTAVSHPRTIRVWSSLNIQ